MTKIQPQLIELSDPVPSLALHAIKYKTKKWSFIYKLYTPYRLCSKPLKVPLYIRGSLQNLTLEETSYKNMIQIPVYTISDLLLLLEGQRAIDLAFRELYKKNNKEAIAHTLTFENANHLFKHKTYIASIKKVCDKTTEFIGIQKDHHGNR